MRTIYMKHPLYEWMLNITNFAYVFMYICMYFSSKFQSFLIIKVDENLISDKKTLQTCYILFLNFNFNQAILLYILENFPYNMYRFHSKT